MSNMIFIPYTGINKKTRFLPIEGKTYRTDHLLPEFREGYEGYFTKKGETFFDYKTKTLYYKGYKVYVIHSLVEEEIAVGEPYETWVTIHGSMEGSTWDKTESYSYEQKVTAQKYNVIFKGIKCEAEAKLGYKKDHDTNDWFSLPEGWEKDIVFFNVEDSYIERYSKISL